MRRNNPKKMQRFLNEEIGIIAQSAIFSPKETGKSTFSTRNWGEEICRSTKPLRVYGKEIGSEKACTHQHFPGEPIMLPVSWYSSLSYNYGYLGVWDPLIIKKGNHQ